MSSKIGVKLYVITIIFITQTQFCWLISQLNKLETRVRMANIGVCPSNQCLLCEYEVEDNAHLFFICHFSQQCLIKIKRWLRMNAITNNYLSYFDGWREDLRVVKSRYKWLVQLSLQLDIKLGRRGTMLFGINIYEQLKRL